MIKYALILIAFMTLNNLNAQKNELIYIGDPMCSWCYGFSGELAKIKDKYAAELDFKLLVGGLRPDETQLMDAAMKRFLEHHWKQVNKASGKEFKYDILKRNDFIYNTFMACKAVKAVKILKPELAHNYFFILQKAFYSDNVDVTVAENCALVAEKMGINKNEFIKTINAVDTSTRAEFSEAHSMGATGFPTVFLKKEGKLIKLCEGYESFEKLDAKIAGLLK
jgi:putative protein-disulfide isomerase